MLALVAGLTVGFLIGYPLTLHPLEPNQFKPGTKV